MSSADIHTIINCVDIASNPGSSNEQKNEANRVLAQFTNSHGYHLVAEEIMQSNDLSISFHCRFFAVNLLLTMFNKEWRALPNENQTEVLRFLESYMDHGVSMDFQRDITLVRKFTQLYATAMTTCWPSQWKNCIDSIQRCISGDEIHVYVAVQVLYYFATDLCCQQDDLNCVNGRKKRIRSFLPHVSGLIQQIVSSIMRLQQSSLSHEIISSFIQFFVIVQKSIPEEMILDNLPLVNSLILPLLNDTSYISDCLSYLTSLAEYTFAKENRSVIRSLIGFFKQIEEMLLSQSLTQELFLTMKQYYHVIDSFVRNQFKQFFPIRSNEEMNLLNMLFNIVLNGVVFPSVVVSGWMIGCLPLLMRPNDIIDQQQQMVQNDVIRRSMDSFVKCYVTLAMHSPQHNTISHLDYDSAAAYQRSFSELKKTIRECLHSLVVMNCLEVYTALTGLLDSPLVKERFSEAAVNCICKGFVEGVKHSLQSDVLTNERLCILYERLQKHLYYENCLYQVDVIQILEILISLISLQTNDCIQAIEPLFYILSIHSKESDGSLECEVAKYIRAIVSSQTSSLMCQYNLMHTRFSYLITMDGLPDQTRSILIKSYLLLILALDDEAIRLSEIQSLISPFISLICFDDALRVWGSSDSFRSCFFNSLSDLHMVTTALNSIADVITSINLFTLRHGLSASFSSQFITAMLQLTRTVLDVSLDESERNAGNGICWTAWCQKEFSNQHCSLTFSHSELILSLFKALMRCWKEILLNEKNDTPEMLGWITELTDTFLKRMRMVMTQEWLFSILIPIYLSSDLPMSSRLLVDFLQHSMSSLVFAMKFPPAVDVLNFCGCSKEIIEIIVHNNRSSFFVSVTNCLLYFIGHSMRGMAMSLANRPFLTAESIYGDGCAAEENRCDTQVVINKRVLWVRDRFLQLFFYSSDDLRCLLFETILLVLRSGLIQAVQLLFSFLIEFLPLLSANRDGDFLVAVFDGILRLYLSTHQDRCKDVTHCCLLIFVLVQNEPTCRLQNGSLLTVEYLVQLMNSILSVDVESITNALSKAMGEKEKKNQILQLRKILETSKKIKKEKGVPMHLCG